MKIATWNINTALYSLKEKTVNYANGIENDIIVIQESKNEKIETGKNLWNNDSSVGDIWTNEGEERQDDYLCGVSVFSDVFKLNLTFEKEYYLKFPFVVIYKVITLDNKKFYLFNIWLKENKKENIKFLDNFKNTIEQPEVKIILENSPVIMAGDFNISPSNYDIWNGIYKLLNDKYKIFSAYHKKFNREFGQEGEDRTYLWPNNKSIHYHCDLCLFSEKYFKIRNVNIKKDVIINGISDHNPVIADIDWK